MSGKSDLTIGDDADGGVMIERAYAKNSHQIFSWDVTRAMVA